MIGKVSRAEGGVAGKVVNDEEAKSRDKMGELKKRLNFLQEQVQRTDERRTTLEEISGVRMRSPFTKGVLEFIMSP